MLFTKKENKEEAKKIYYQALDNCIMEEYERRMKQLTLEEIRTPATHETEVCVKIIGSKVSDIGIGEKEISEEINSCVYHRNQIISITDGGANGAFGMMSKVLTVMYWKIVDVNDKIYEEIANKIYTENPFEG